MRKERIKMNRVDTYFAQQRYS